MPIRLIFQTGHVWQNSTAMAHRKPKTGRKYKRRSTLEQLVVLSYLESINAVLIHQRLTKVQRLLQLNAIAITQMKSLAQNAQVKKLK